MTPAEEVQDLLRFLSRDAKLPLAMAMSKINELRKSNLSSPDLISKTSLPKVQSIIPDEKLAKQVFTAAKRVTKKGASTGTGVAPASKRARSSPDPHGIANDARALEASLRLPLGDATESELRSTTIQTNRAPLVLAFTVTLLKYTMPGQPLSSRLSLAQAVVSMNSKAKAQAIGLDKSTSAEDEGWGQGQPKVKIMGRGDIPVMRRGGYEVPDEDVVENLEDPSNKKTKLEDKHEQVEVKPQPESSGHEALWGLDLEALRKSNGTLHPASTFSTRGASSSTGLPIYSPQSARAYLLRSFTILNEETPPDSTSSTIKTESQTKTSTTSPSKPKKKTPAQLTADKEHALGLVSQAIDMLLKSWSTTLSRDELDRRAWSWYVAVRPEVAMGEKGWGQKGRVELGAILGLREER